MANSWRELSAPDLSIALRALQGSGDALNSAFAAGKTGLKDWEDRQINETSNQLMAKLMTQYQDDPAGLSQAMRDGSLMKGYDPRKLNAQTIASIGARWQDLQNAQLGSKNIDSVALRNDRSTLENDDLRYTSKNTRDDTQFLRTTGRDLGLQFDAIVASKGRSEAIKWFTDPAQQARMVGAPLDYARGIIDRATAVPLDATKLDAAVEDVNIKREEVKSAPGQRAYVASGTEVNNANAAATQQATAIGADARAAGQIAYEVLSLILSQGNGNTDGIEQRLEQEIRTNPRLRGNPQAQEAARGLIAGYGYKPYAPIKDPTTGQEITNGVVPADTVAPAPEFTFPSPAPLKQSPPVGRGKPTAAVNPLGLPQGTPAVATPASALIENAVNGEGTSPLLNIAASAAGPASKALRAMVANGTAPGAPQRGRVNPNRVMNPDARALGINVVPSNVQTLGQASQFAKQVNRAGAASSAMGTFQIIGTTMRDYAPRVFGKNWQNQPYNDDSQYRLGNAIFQDNKGSAAALKKQWVSLSLSEAESVRKLSWAEASRIIASKESGNGSIGVPQGVYADQNFGASIPALMPPVSATLAALNGPVALENNVQSRNQLQNEEAILASNNPQDELLRQMIIERNTPKPILALQSDPRRRTPSTNVAALLGHAGAVLRYS